MQVINRENLLPYLERQSKAHVLTLGYGLVVVLGILDYLTGTEIAFATFYFLPVALVSYFVSRQAGLLAAVISAVTWLWADLAAGHIYAHPLTAYWNMAMRLISFVVVAWLVTAWRLSFEHEKQLARSDFLTGAANSRSFFELASWEINRSRRYEHPFSVAHIDVDNFKTVNDTLGHSAGDDLLCLIVKTLQASLRETDVVARLGGDEFAVLLPETDQEQSRFVVQKAQQELMAAMRKHQWPVSFSMGVLTCLAPPQTVDELLKLADKLTYSAKNSGKNTIKYEAIAS